LVKKIRCGTNIPYIFLSTPLLGCGHYHGKNRPVNGFEK